MDKGKTTRMISGGGYCDKNGKRHQWSKLHVPQPEITDDNWMEYGMPDDEDNKVSNESRNMKKTLRLTESELKEMISKMVKRTLNEIGDTDKFHDMLGMSDGYNSYMGNTRKSNRAYGLSTQLQKNQNNGQLYDPKSEESAANYRRNTRAYQSGFSRGWDKAKAEKEKLKSQVAESVRRALNEEFEDEFNAARQNYNRPLWGFEMKNQEGEWQYGDITYDPNTNTMSCMGVSIEVDPSLSVDQNLEALYEELMNNGFTDGDE